MRNQHKHKSLVSQYRIDEDSIRVESKPYPCISFMVLAKKSALTLGDQRHTMYMEGNIVYVAPIQSTRGAIYGLKAALKMALPDLEVIDTLIEREDGLRHGMLFHVDRLSELNRMKWDRWMAR